jgi:hypothetical protein
MRGLGPGIGRCWRWERTEARVSSARGNSLMLIPALPAAGEAAKIREAWFGPGGGAADAAHVSDYSAVLAGCARPSDRCPRKKNPSEEGLVQLAALRLLHANYFN